MYRYKIVIKDLYLPKTRNVFTTSRDVYTAHKKGLNTVNLQREDIFKIYDYDNKQVYSSTKGFLSPQ
jgi:hypothetical protein